MIPNINNLTSPYPIVQTPPPEPNTTTQQPLATQTSQLDRPEATAQWGFLHRLQRDVQQQSRKSKNKPKPEPMHHPSRLRLTMCGTEQDSARNNANVRDSDRKLIKDIGMMLNRGEPEKHTYTEIPGQGTNLISIHSNYGYGEALNHRGTSDDIDLQCPNGQPYLEFGDKSGAVLFTGGCEQGNQPCKHYREWNPEPDKSSCVIL